MLAEWDSGWVPWVWARPSVTPPTPPPPPLPAFLLHVCRPWGGLMHPPQPYYLHDVPRDTQTLALFLSPQSLVPSQAPVPGS